MHFHTILQLNLVFILTISQKKKNLSYLSMNILRLLQKTIECKNFRILILIIPIQLVSIGTSVM